MSEEPRDPSPRVPPKDLRSLVDGNSAFAFDFYRQVRGNGGNRSRIIVDRPTSARVKNAGHLAAPGLPDSVLQFVIRDLDPTPVHHQEWPGLGGCRGAGSRGSHCVLDDGGTEMHPHLSDPAGGAPYRFKAENLALRDHILVVRYDQGRQDLFEARDEKPRPIPQRDVAFEVAWREFREGRIYGV